MWLGLSVKNQGKLKSSARQTNTLLPFMVFIESTKKPYIFTWITHHCDHSSLYVSVKVVLQVIPSPFSLVNALSVYCLHPNISLTHTSAKHLQKKVTPYLHPVNFPFIRALTVCTAEHVLPFVKDTLRS